MKNTPLVIDYYTDVLCVWAWIAQKRVEETLTHFGTQIELRYSYVDVFGDTAKKIQRQWAQRGGYQGFAEHVQESAAEFEDTPVNTETWTDIRPTTSGNAHMVLRAVESVFGTQASRDLALSIRKAFFIEAKDISDLNVLFSLVKNQNLAIDPITESISSGTAMASLLSDYQHAKQQGIKGSPSYMMDNGRQILYGNVGYRVLRANIEELLRNPADEASWC